MFCHTDLTPKMQANEKYSMYMQKPPNFNLYEAIGEILISCGPYGCVTRVSILKGLQAFKEKKNPKTQQKHPPLQKHALENSHLNSMLIRFFTASRVKK